MLDKLHEEERAIWGKKIDAAALWLGALRPLGAWTDAEHVAAWWDARAATLAAKSALAGRRIKLNCCALGKAESLGALRGAARLHPRHRCGVVPR